MADKRANQFPQYIASISATLGGFQIGILLGWSNVVQQEIEAGKYRFPCSKEQFSWVSSCFVLGAMFVCIPAGYLVDLIGRKWTMIVMCIPLFFGWMLVIFAQSILWLYIARFLVGIAGGSYSVAVPVYVAEIAQKEIRGILGTLYLSMMSLGLLFIYIIGAFLKTLEVCLISSAFPVTMMILLLFMPESPTYLIKKDKEEAANKSLTWLRGIKYDFKHEIDDIKTVDAYDKANPISVGAAIKRPETVRAFLISTMLMILQQFCGINVIVFYSTDIFREANTGYSPAFSTMYMGIVRIFAIVFAMMTVDRLGRRSLLLLSGILLAFSCICLGTYFFMEANDPASTDLIGWLPLVSVYLFNIMFTIGYGPIPWLMNGELFSTDIKGLASSVTATINWFFAFVVAKTYINLNNLFGVGGTFMLFGGITALGVVLIYFFVIETKGKSLNEIQAELVSLSKQDKQNKDKS